MSLNMYLGASDEQARSTTQMANAQIAACQSVQQAVQQFVADTESLKGKAYDSARD